jgi:urease accessory protein
MAWHAQLDLTYSSDAGRTALQFSHDGPLRVLQSLYPEGPAVCHNVLVHPPGGLVAGDVIDVNVRVGEGAQALITTPGATRFYRRAKGSSEAPAVQRVRIAVAAHARLEWLPLESIAYPDCQASNQLEFTLESGAQMLGWDCTSLGLPAADQAFDAPQAQSSFEQRLAWPGCWLERGRFEASDAQLLNGPLGLNGKRAMATLWWAQADGFASAQREAALDAARSVLADQAVRAGATSPNTRLVVVRAASDMVEPIMRAFIGIRGAWLRQAWGRSGEAPRIWSM